MNRRNATAFFTTVVLLQLMTVAAAHGKDESGDNTTAAMSNSSDEPHPPPESYMRHPEHVTLILAHIALMTAGWVFCLPVAVVFSVARSRLTAAAQIVFLSINVLGVLTGIIYNRLTPSLYEHGNHGTAGYTITLLVFAWVLLGLVDTYTNRNLDKRRRAGTDSSLQHEASGWRSENSMANITAEYSEEYNENDSGDDEKHGFLRGTVVDRFLKGNFARFRRTVRAIRLFHLVLERAVLVLGFLGITTGIVIYTGIFRGRNIFNGLAHFIKGGIFFWYGFLTFARWMGCFADMGWAWNLKPSRSLVGKVASMPSAEFVESAVICFYGVSNVFLERLANTDGKWAAIDLEHVSITLLFFGGGLLGMIIESTYVRDLLRSNLTIIRADSALPGESASFSQPKQYPFSMNPMPALIIFLLGRMMSSHHQASMLSSMIHTQWGNLFSGFALARMATYFLLYVQPPVGHLPQRPPTEVLSSFCLVGGGMLFMMSNRDTVTGLEWNELDAMFTFNVAMGLTAFLMAWSTVVMALKGWAQLRVAKERENQIAAI
ncbi:integral membrane protein [Xylogone sp. PMI_703]|nr:integral membrane protein [Xylogone sp. PMI_703]